MCEAEACLTAACKIGQVALAADIDQLAAWLGELVELREKLDDADGAVAASLAAANLSLARALNGHSTLRYLAYAKLLVKLGRFSQAVATLDTVIFLLERAGPKMHSPSGLGEAARYSVPRSFESRVTGSRQLFPSNVVALAAETIAANPIFKRYAEKSDTHSCSSRQDRPKATLLHAAVDGLLQTIPADSSTARPAIEAIIMRLETRGNREEAGRYRRMILKQQSP